MWPEMAAPRKSNPTLPRTYSSTTLYGGFLVRACRSSRDGTDTVSHTTELPEFPAIHLICLVWQLRGGPQFLLMEDVPYITIGMQSQGMVRLTWCRIYQKKSCSRLMKKKLCELSSKNKFFNFSHIQAFQCLF